jgi:hypothetical protein
VLSKGKRAKLRARHQAPITRRAMPERSGNKPLPGACGGDRRSAFVTYEPRAQSERFNPSRPSPVSRGNRRRAEKDGDGTGPVGVHNRTARAAATLCISNRVARASKGVPVFLAGLLQSATTLGAAVFGPSARIGPASTPCQKRLPCAWDRRRRTHLVVPAVVDDQVPCSGWFRQRVRLETEQPTWLIRVPWITWSSTTAGL